MILQNIMNLVCKCIFIIIFFYVYNSSSGLNQLAGWFWPARPPMFDTTSFRHLGHGVFKSHCYLLMEFTENTSPQACCVNTNSFSATQTSLCFFIIILCLSDITTTTCDCCNSLTVNLSLFFFFFF